MESSQLVLNFFYAIVFDKFFLVYHSTEIECGDAPPAENAFIEYTGEGFERVAHYICNEGTYTAAGDVSRKCTGSGKWGGKLIKCERKFYNVCIFVKTND